MAIPGTLDLIKDGHNRLLSFGRQKSRPRPPEGESRSALLRRSTTQLAGNGPDCAAKLALWLAQSRRFTTSRRLERTRLVRQPPGNPHTYQTVDFLGTQ